MLPLISIYKLSDLGDLSNLIGSLSRTIQQYSPPGEWIMCELGAFPKFLFDKKFCQTKNHRKSMYRNRQTLWAKKKIKKNFKGMKYSF